MNHDKFSKAYILALCRKAAKLTGFSVEGDTVPTLIGHLRAPLHYGLLCGNGLYWNPAEDDADSFRLLAVLRPSIYLGEHRVKMSIYSTAPFDTSSGWVKVTATGYAKAMRMALLLCCESAYDQQVSVILRPTAKKGPKPKSVITLVCSKCQKPYEETALGALASGIMKTDPVCDSCSNT